MRIDNCYYCSGKIYPGHGSVFVRNDCKVFKFCRPKCQRKFKVKKNPRQVRWTKAFRKTVGKELTVDPSFEFERRRNVPVKYNRELWQQTVESISRISDIQNRRKENYIHNRLKVGKYSDLHSAKTLVKKHMHLLRVAAADLKRPTLEVDEVKMEDEIPSKIEPGTSHLNEKKRVATKKVSEDREMIEEDDDDDDVSSDSEEDGIRSDDFSDDAMSTDVDEPNLTIAEEVPLDSAVK